MNVQIDKSKFERMSIFENYIIRILLLYQTLISILDIRDMKKIAVSK